MSGELVTMGLGNFLNQTVRARKAQLAADSCGTAASFLQRGGPRQEWVGRSVPESLDSEASQHELSAINGLAQFMIVGPEEMQRTDTPSLIDTGLFQVSGEFADRVLSSTAARAS